MNLVNIYLLLIISSIVTTYSNIMETAPDQPKEMRSDTNDTTLEISYDQAYKILCHDRHMIRSISSIPFAILYFVVFTMMLFTHVPSNTLYQQWNAVSSTLSTSGTDAINADTTIKFCNIGSISDVYSWMSDTLFPSVFISEDYNGHLLPKEMWSRVAMYNKVLGAVSFRLKSANVQPCQTQPFLKTLYPSCYDPSSITETVRYISFDTNMTEATEILSIWKNNGKWLNDASRELTITVITYNGELQGYTVTTLTLTFQLGGSIVPTEFSTPALSDPYRDTAPLFMDILVGICFIMQLILMITRSQLFRKRKTINQSLTTPSVLDYPGLTTLCKKAGGSSCLSFATEAKIAQPTTFPNTSPWTFVEILGSLLVAGYYIVWLSIVSMMYSTTFQTSLATLVIQGKGFNDNSDERQKLQTVTSTLQFVAKMTVLGRLIGASAIISLGLSILGRFRFHPRLCVLTSTIGHSLKEFSAFSIVFAVIYIMFSVLGTLLFGDRVYEFSSLLKSMEACVNMLFGNFDYSTIQGIYDPVATLYYWGYMVVVSLILLNMMLAIVLDSYTQVTQYGKEFGNVSLSRASCNVIYQWCSVLYPLRKSTLQSGPTMTDIAKGNKWNHQDVIMWGRIRPWVLESELKKKLFNLEFEGEQTQKPQTIDPEPGESVEKLTIKGLIDMFPGAKITVEEARATLESLNSGN